MQIDHQIKQNLAKAGMKRTSAIYQTCIRIIYKPNNTGTLEKKPKLGK